MDDFLINHRVQLEMSGVPDIYWDSLYKKLQNEIFDSDDYFMILRVEPDSSDEESDDTSTPPWTVVINKSGGIKKNDPKQIYLIDHAWTYRPNNARNDLSCKPGLLERMSKLMDIFFGEENCQESIDRVFDKMWKFNQSYSIDNNKLGTESGNPIWYIMDEFGSRINHSDRPSVKMVPFYYSPSKITFTLMWPLLDLQNGDEITRDFLNNPNMDQLSRRLLMLPWFYEDFTELPFYQTDQDEEIFYRKFKVHSSLPEEQHEEQHANIKEILSLAEYDKVKVFTKISQISDNLTSGKFEMVSSAIEADVIWTNDYIEDFKTFSTECSKKLINQFPFEMVITVKNMLAIICRRNRNANATKSDYYDFNPLWLPFTYDLKRELPHFVSFFQYREHSNADNYWIVKPYNLARSVDVHITNNLNYILRLSETGPKIACKYITDPVLFQRADVGLVKFDMRFIVLLRSASPLRLFACRDFLVRVANKPFSLDNFDDYEKHFTVMNYKENVKMKSIVQNDFIEDFQKQYPNHKWSSITEKVHKMLKEIFDSATSEKPPKGIGHCVQSRAMYGVDVMLKWNELDSGGKKIIQPVLIEINFGPDNTRFLGIDSNFINNVFSVLFLDEVQNERVISI